MFGPSFPYLSNAMSSSLESQGVAGRTLEPAEGESEVSSPPAAGFPWSFVKGWGWGKGEEAAGSGGGWHEQRWRGQDGLPVPVASTSAWLWV